MTRRSLLDRDGIIRPSEWQVNHPDVTFTGSDMTMALTLLDNLNFDILVFAEHTNWLGFENSLEFSEENSNGELRHIDGEDAS